MSNRGNASYELYCAAARNEDLSVSLLGDFHHCMIELATTLRLRSSLMKAVSLSQPYYPSKTYKTTHNGALAYARTRTTPDGVTIRDV